jgi:hypothetical protein
MWQLISPAFDSPAQRELTHAIVYQSPLSGIANPMIEKFNTVRNPFTTELAFAKFL